MNGSVKLRMVPEKGLAEKEQEISEKNFKIRYEALSEEEKSKILMN